MNARKAYRPYTRRAVRPSESPRNFYPLMRTPWRTLTSFSPMFILMSPWSIEDSSIISGGTTSRQYLRSL